MWDATITQIGAALSGLFNISVMVFVKLLAFSQSMVQKKPIIVSSVLSPFVYEFSRFIFLKHIQKILLFVV